MLVNGGKERTRKLKKTKSWAACKHEKATVTNAASLRSFPSRDERLFWNFSEEFQQQIAHNIPWTIIMITALDGSICLIVKVKLEIFRLAGENANLKS